MHFRPKLGIFTKSLKKSLKWRVFLEFTLKLLIPLWMAHDHTLFFLPKTQQHTFTLILFPNHELPLSTPIFSSHQLGLARIYGQNFVKKARARVSRGWNFRCGLGFASNQVLHHLGALGNDFWVLEHPIYRLIQVAYCEKSTRKLDIRAAKWVFYSLRDPRNVDLHFWYLVVYDYGICW
jgi:hypothetical protein